MESKFKWIRYISDNLHKFLVWFIFLFVTAILVYLSAMIISRIPIERKQGAYVEEVKIYFPESEPDTLLTVIQEQLEAIQETIEMMRNDSISVSVKKLSK